MRYQWLKRCERFLTRLNCPINSFVPPCMKLTVQSSYSTLSLHHGIQQVFDVNPVSAFRTGSAALHCSISTFPGILARAVNLPSCRSTARRSSSVHCLELPFLPGLRHSGFMSIRHKNYMLITSELAIKKTPSGLNSYIAI
jgi:hypothetical protein